MEENEKTLNESLDRIKNMMDYDPETPLTEQTARELRKSGIESRKAAKATRRAEIDYSRLNWYVKRIERNMKDIDTIYGHLRGKTYEGHDAIAVVQSTYKDKSGGRDLPQPPVVQEKTTDTNVDGVTGAPAAAGYTQCIGGINKFGCKSNAIAQVQGMIGAKADGMFGPKTKEMLAAVVPEYSNQFSDADVATIQQKITQSKTPQVNKMNLEPLAPKPTNP